MNTAPCNCHTETVQTGLNERPRYYARQLVTPDDLTLDQNYVRAKLRRHNRYLHGWGVVCGAEVVAAEKDWKVIVKQGYVLGPYGDEIYISKDQCVDVRQKCTPEEPAGDDCIEAQPEPAPPGTKQFIAIRYVEKKSRLIRVPLGGCGCEDRACEYSRFADGYEICVIDECPASHKDPPAGSPIPDNGESPGCPECESEPWVVLSAFTVDETGKVKVELCDCRRHMVGFGSFWWACRPGAAGHRARKEPAKPAPTTPTTPTPQTTPGGTATPATPAGTATLAGNVIATPAATATPPAGRRRRK